MKEGPFGFGDQEPISSWRHDWVLDLDVKGYFNSIDWELMLKAVRRHTDCPWVLLYIERG
jgi:retron-type reverse transcriptase